MRLAAISTAALVIVTATSGLAWGDYECDVTGSRAASADAAAVAKVVVTAGAGSLEIRGVAGAREVSGTGKACASSQSLLDAIELRVERHGDVLEVEAVMPKSYSNGAARLDLVVEMPAHLALEVDDGSGELTITGVAALRLEDGSGEASVADIAGDVTITDGSGELRVERVGGTLRLEDGSGGIDVRGVGGDVIIEEDGSGGIEIAGVEGSVRIKDDGSGDIHVADVNGDLEVGDDGSGGVSYERIGGRVMVEDER
jgi:hypothetical protein